jgi:L-ascorbate metabolism protein UlaG (beta-lactamase superfamily)
LKSLPEISVILLSHDHYDHCDLPTLRELARRQDPWVVTPLGNGGLVRRAGLRKVVELDWWESWTAPEGTQVLLTPAKHWSNRLSGRRNGRLWGGFRVLSKRGALQFVGDTGYDPFLFQEIRRRLGPVDLAFIPIGAYEPRWFMAPQHCNPEEAVRIHRDLEARTSIAMHWGCWQLTDEAREAPPTQLAKALHEAGLDAADFQVLQPGCPFQVKP